MKLLASCFSAGLLLLLIWQAEAIYPYYGRLISSNWGTGSYSGLSGDVYAVSNDSFQIINFVLDDQAGNAVLYLGTDKSYRDAQALDGFDPTAVALKNPLGTSEVLPSYNGQKAVFRLPGQTSLSNVTYVAVYSQNSSAYLGGMDIPNGFQVPAPQNIGKFTGRAHSVSSGDVIVIDDRTIMINNLRYDGQGPDAFFYVGVTDRVVLQDSPYGKIPDENGVIDRKAGAYSDRDIVLTLPEGISATDLKWLSIYCITYTHNFGEVMFPETLNVPPYAQADVNQTAMKNCEPLGNRLQVSWTVSDDAIVFELAGNIDQSADYMAFGLSGSDSGFSMLDADVVVADWTEELGPRALDYKLTAYSQCADNGGACPDESSSNGGVNNVVMVSGELTNGIVRIMYERALSTGDANDKSYRTDGVAQQIVWAIGPINSKGEAAKHYGPSEGGRISESTAIDFGREIKDNCPAFVVQPEVEKPDFLAHHIYGDEVDSFTFEIGQSASEQGYKAITGSPSWGIAWYVNGVLVPELHLQRGVEYTFRVGGGDNSSQSSMYHPLYITSDVNGGLQQKQVQTETVYPGTVGGEEKQFATGGYCEWKLTGAAISDVDDGKVYQCFEEFQDDLYLDCAPNSSGYTEFKWTPTADTPDLVYYQCYTHANLGWKINVYDQLPTSRLDAPADCTSSSTEEGAISPTSSTQATAATSSKTQETGDANASNSIALSSFVFTFSVWLVKFT